MPEQFPENQDVNALRKPEKPEESEGNRTDVEAIRRSTDAFRDSLDKRDALKASGKVEHVVLDALSPSAESQREVLGGLDAELDFSGALHVVGDTRIDQFIQGMSPPSIDLVGGYGVGEIDASLDIPIGPINLNVTTTHADDFGSLNQSVSVGTDAVAVWVDSVDFGANVSVGGFDWSLYRGKKGNTFNLSGGFKGVTLSSAVDGDTLTDLSLEVSPMAFFGGDDVIAVDGGVDPSTGEVYGSVRVGFTF